MTFWNEPSSQRVARWAIEITRERDASRELVRKAIKAGRALEPAVAVSFHLLTVMTAIEGYEHGEEMKVSQASDELVDCHKRLTHLGVLQPIALWCIQEFRLEPGQVKAYVETNDDRGEGLCEAAAKLGITNLYMNSKKSLLRKSLGKVVDYCVLNLPLTCNLVVYQGNKKLRVLSATNDMDGFSLETASIRRPSSTPQSIPLSSSFFTNRSSSESLSQWSTSSDSSTPPISANEKTTPWKTLARVASPNQTSPDFLASNSSRGSAPTVRQTSSNLSTPKLSANDGGGKSPPWQAVGKSFSRKSAYFLDSDPTSPPSSAANVIHDRDHFPDMIAFPIDPLDSITSSEHLTTEYIIPIHSYQNVGNERKVVESKGAASYAGSDYQSLGPSGNLHGDVLVSSIANYPPEQGSTLAKSSQVVDGDRITTRNSHQRAIRSSRRENPEPFFSTDGTGEREAPEMLREVGILSGGNGLQMDDLGMGSESMARSANECSPAASVSKAHDFAGLIAELVRVTEVVAAAQRAAQEAQQVAEAAKEESRKAMERTQAEEKRRRKAEGEREKERVQRQRAEEERLRAEKEKQKAEEERERAVKQAETTAYRAAFAQAEADAARIAALEAAAVASASLAEAQQEYAAERERRQVFRIYTEEEIKAATDNFSTDRIIGDGGYGTVYRGILAHTPVAVKKIKNENLAKALAEFKKEVEFHAGLRHPHLVLLMGHCSEPPCLVYELMANGSLHDRLTDVKGSPLSWNMRFDIFESLCRALLYLHCREPPIVHLDVKPANILLDKTFVAKVGDVGLAQFLINMDPTKSYMQHTSAVGTVGYVDPMYSRLGQFSVSSDVFSLGRVLWDLLIGISVETNAVDGDKLEGLEAAAERNSIEEMQNILDPSAGKWPGTVALQLCHVASRCCQVRRRDRPDLGTQVMPLVCKLREEVDQILKEELEKAGKEEEMEMKSFLCPIKQDIMENPVIAADGFTYERDAIEQWLQHHDTSPITSEVLPSNSVVPNHNLRSLIQEFREKRARKKRFQALNLTERP